LLKLTNFHSYLVYFNAVVHPIPLLWTKLYQFQHANTPIPLEYRRWLRVLPPSWRYRPDALSRNCHTYIKVQYVLLMFNNGYVMHTTLWKPLTLNPVHVTFHRQVAENVWQRLLNGWLFFSHVSLTYLLRIQ
jgi:hypothetical protein